MDKAQASYDPTVLSTNLDLSPLFRKGLVVYAWADASGSRVVTIEDHDSLYSYGETADNATQSQNIAIGKGAHVEHALKQALIANTNNLSYDQMYKSRRKHPQGSNKASSILDKWLLRHKGTMSVVLDEDDGYILCTLDGLKTSSSLSSERITLRGKGWTIHSALKDAFMQYRVSTVQTSE